MRIEYLSLPAFGMFTNQTIQFGKDYGFHLIYGFNEAGKSTILRAITDALFGIPHNTSDGFRHNYSELRIEMRLRLAKGDVITFRRRKGTKNTILDLNDQSLNDRVLEPYTAGLDRQGFEDMFGLDHLRLREGGKHLLQSQGALSESLFEAASGMRDLRDIMVEFENKAAELYKSTGRKPVVNRLAKQYKEDKQAIHDAALSAHKFKELKDEYQHQRSQLKVLEDKLGKANEHQSKLKRLGRTMPLLAKRAQLCKELEELGDLPQLTEDSKKLYKDNTEILRQANKEKKATEDQMKALEQDSKSIVIPQAILEQEEAIDELQEGLSEYRKSVRELPKLENKLDLKRHRALLKLQEICPEAQDLAEADQYRLPLDLVTTVEELADHYHQLENQHQKAQEALNSREEDLCRADELLGQFDPIADTDALQQLISQIQRQGDLDKAYQKIELDVNKLQADLDNRLKRLSFWDRTLAELVTAKFPLAETIATFVEQQEALTDQIQRVEQEITDLKERKRSCEGDLTKLEATGDVPSEDELKAARERRSYGWQLVLKSWIDKKPDRKAEKAFDPEKPLHVAYEASVAVADQIANDLRCESDRVANKANLTADLTIIDKKLRQKLVEVKTLQNEQQELDQRWIKIWPQTNIDPLSPKEMAQWLHDYQEIVKDYRQMEEQKLIGCKLKEQIRDYTTTVQQTLTELGFSSQGSLSDLLEIASNVCREASERKGEQKRLKEAVTEQTEAVKQAKKQKEAAAQQLEQWSTRWSELMQQIKLSPNATVKVAQTFISELNALFSMLQELAEDEKLKRQLETHITEYKANVQAVATKTEVTVEPSTVPETVKQLARICKQARNDQVTLREITKQIQVKKQELTQLKLTITHAQEQIDHLMTEAKCSTPAELEKILVRLEKAATLKTDIKVNAEGLIHNGDGLSIDTLAEEASGIDVDAIKTRLMEIEQEIKALRKEQQELNQRFGITKKDYDEKVQGTSIAAHEAAEKSQDTLVRLANSAEKYMKLRLSSRVLKRAMDLYRDQHQDPVLQRASDIFKQLTEASFSHLIVDYDDGDNPVIKGVRRNEVLSISEMSDGTQDQLYLALRLATIEYYLDKAEPMPFIVDDILVNFDDIRSAAALTVLGKLAKRTQVIMFTHHLTIAEQAKKVLPADRLTIHTLGNDNQQERKQDILK